MPALPKIDVVAEDKSSAVFGAVIANADRVSDSIGGMKQSFLDAASAVTGISAVKSQMEVLSVSVDALSTNVANQTTGWRATAGALGSFTTGLKSGLDIFEKFGGITPKWTRDFDAAKTKVNETSGAVSAWTKNLFASNKAANDAIPAMQGVSTGTAATANGFRAAIPAVGGFVAALGPVLIVGALIAAALAAAKAAADGVGDAIGGTIPGFGAARSVMDPFVKVVGDAAVAAEDFAVKFGYGAVAASTFIEMASRLKYSADDGAVGMQKLSDAVASSPEKFAALGIAVRDSAGQMRPLNDIAQDTQKALAGYATQADKSGVANDLFAGTTAQLSAAIKATGPEFEKQQALLREYGLLMGTDAVADTKKFQDAQNEFTYQADLTWRSLKNTIGGFFMPILTDMFEMFTGGWPKVAQAFRTGAVFIAENLYGMRGAILNWIDGVQWRWEKLKVMLSAGVDIASAAKNFDKAGIVAAYEQMQTQLATMDKSAIKQREAREIEYVDRIRKLRELGLGGGAAATQGTKRWVPPEIEEDAKAAAVAIDQLQKQLDALYLKLDGGEDFALLKELDLLKQGFAAGKLGFVDFNMRMAQAVLTSQTYKKAIDEVTKSTEENNAILNANRQAVEDAAVAMSGGNDALRVEITGLGKTKLERELYNLALNKTIDLRRIDLTLNEKEQADAVVRIEKLYAQREALLLTRDAVEQQQSAWQSVSGVVNTFYSDLISRNGNAFSNLWRTAKDFFTKITAEFLTKHTLNFVFGGSGGGDFLSSLLGGSSGGSGSGIFGSLGSLFGGLGGIGSGILSGLVGPGSAIGSALGLGSAVGAPTFLAGAGVAGGAGTAAGTISGILAAIPVWGWVALAASAVAAFAFKDEKGIKFDNSVRGVGNPSSHWEQNAISQWDISGDLPRSAVAPFADRINAFDKWLADNLLSEESIAIIRDRLQATTNPDWWNLEDKNAVENASLEFLRKRYGIIFGEIDAEVAGMVQTFQGSADELLAFIDSAAQLVNPFKALQDAMPSLNLSLADFLSLTVEQKQAIAALAGIFPLLMKDAFGEVERIMAAAGRGTISTFRSQADVMLDMALAFKDGKLSLEAFAQAGGEMAVAFANATAKIAEIRAGLDELIAGKREDYALSGMTPEQQYAYFQQQADDLFTQLATATDPEQIDRITRRIIDYMDKANALLDPGQRANGSPGYLQGLDRVDQLRDERLTVATTAAQNIAREVKDGFAAAFAEWTKDQKALADMERETANINRATATTPRQVDVDVDVEVDVINGTTRTTVNSN